MDDRDETARGWEDPIVAEVRDIRDAHARKFDYDIDAICDDLFSQQAKYRQMGFKYVTLPPKKRATGTGVA